jgi:SAM-dependent methyltransferase
VIDVGCGQGLLLEALKARHPLVRRAGLESSPDAIRRARARGLDITCVDLAFLARRSAKVAAALVNGFDLAVCLETAEHLPPWSASPLVHVLTRAPMVLFSAAPPGQGGTSHINEQPHEYWRKRFVKEGFDLDRGDDALRSAVARLDLPWWYAANIHLYSRRPTDVVGSL